MAEVDLSYAAAGIIEGIAKGTAQRQQVEMQRARAMQEQQLAQQRFSMEQQRFGMEQQQAQIELDNLRRQNQQLQAQQMRELTYQSFDKFNGDGDVRHLNNFIARTKELDPDSPFAQATRVDSLDGIDYQDAIKLLQQANIEDPEAAYNDAKGSMVVATGKDGTRSLVSLPKLYAATGYTRYADQRTLKDLETKAQIENLLTGPKSAETSLIRDIAKQNGISLSEAVQVYKQATAKTSATSTLERTAQVIRDNNPGMSEEEALRQASQLIKTGGTAAEREAQTLADSQNIPYEQALEQVNARRERSGTQVKLDEAQAVREQLDTLGDGSFFEADLTNPVTRRKAGPMITELEALTGKSLTTEDKRLARNIRELTMLGAKAGQQITDEETGIIDRLMRQVKSYTTNEVGDGTAGTAAYETFRNIFRNSLYGASLTESEIKAFDTATGTLGQQTGPVLVKLNEAMRSMREQLKGIYDLNDEYVAQYYVGQSLDELDAAIEAIDERIDLVGRGISSEQASATRMTAEPTPGAVERKQLIEDVRARQAELDAIFGGAK